MVSSFTIISLFVSALVAPSIAVPTADKLVLTPGGYRSSSSVFRIPEGGSIAHVGENVQILDAHGNLSVALPSKTTDAVKPEATGWVAYAYWLNSGSSPISSFVSTWTVPPVPATNHDQTLFLFNSIEPNSGNAILQPVLQWGESAAGGGAYWSVASWYLVGSSTSFTTPVRVSAGQSLTGIISLTASSGSKYSYVTSFSGISGTSLSVANAAQLTWATLTLETYATTSSSDYPTGSTVFSNTTLKLSSGTPSVTWTTVSDPADGLSTVVNTQGATNAKVTITY